MRKLYFLFPELHLQQGGHSAQMEFLKLSQRFCAAEAVTYQKSSDGILHLDELLKRDPDELQACIFVIHWGPHVSKLLKRLKGLAVAYIAHSTGWGFKLPSNVPILAVSRHTQSYWASRAPRNPIFHLPNVISDDFYNSQDERSTDVLVMKRKTSNYVLNELVPLLRSCCKVRVIDGWVDDVGVEMRDSKMFLYDSSEHWKKQGVSEGFGLPPLEAIASGCGVFSSLNHALSDYLDPSVNCHQLGVHSTEYDCNRILNALRQWSYSAESSQVIKEYRSDRIAARMHILLPTINEFFELTREHNKSSQSGKIKNYLSTHLQMSLTGLLKL